MKCRTQKSEETRDIKGEGIGKASKDMNSCFNKPTRKEIYYMDFKYTDEKEREREKGGIEREKGGIDRDRDRERERERKRESREIFRKRYHKQVVSITNVE
jgi:hypothetical protein